MENHNKEISKVLYILLVILNTVAFCHAQNNLHTINSISPADTSFHDLDFLKTTLENAKIVGLGEQSHMDGSTFEAKIRLIKYLHEDLNFDVIAFESGFYDCNKANEEIKKTSGNNPNSLFNAIFGVWHSKEVTELSKYINETQSTKHPLILAGFDCQFAGTYAKNHFIDEYFKLLHGLEVKNGIQIIKDSTALATALSKEIKYSNYYLKLPKEDTLILSDNFDLFYNITKNDSSIHVQIWQTILRNMQMDYRRHFDMNSNLRDSMMALNILQLNDQIYPDKKIILWSANRHLAYNIDSIKPKKYTGEWVKQSLKDKYYCILFTSAKAKYKLFFLNLKYPKISSTGIETYLSR